MIIAILLPIISLRLVFYFFFFFSSRRRHTRCSRDWSSDVCSSDLGEIFDVRDVAHLDDAFRALIQRIKTRYTLGYYTHATAAEGKPHKLDIRLAPMFGKKGCDYVVLAKTGFYEIGRASCRERV